MIGSSYVYLTGPGLETAEDYGVSIAYDLWEAIDELSGTSRKDEPAGERGEADGSLPSRGIVVRTSGPISPDDETDISGNGRIIKFDHMSDVFRGIENDIKNTLRLAKADNTLMDDVEGSRRIAELEAGATLLGAKQGDVGLIRRLLLDSLKWLLKKVRDDGASAVINALIVAVTAWLSAT